MKCEYCHNEAVAILNKGHYLCRDCIERVSIDLLNRGETLGYAVKGDLRVVLKPIIQSMN